MDAQQTLQVIGQGRDPANIPEDERAEFFRWNVLAAVAELIEALDEIKWKPWAQGEHYENRKEVIGELIDVMHFIGNLLLMVGATGEELSEAYRAKAQKNLDRWQSGYTGLDKCSVCRRDETERPPPGVCQNEGCPYIIQGNESPVGCWNSDCTDQATEFIRHIEITPGGQRQITRVKVCARHAEIYYQDGGQ